MNTTIRATPGRLTALALGLPLMLAAIAWGAFSLVGLLAHTSERHHASYAWSGGLVSLDLDSGDATIRTSDTHTVSVEYTEHYELKRPTARGAASPTGVALTGRCPSGILGQNCSINYVITVPKQAALKLHLGDGSLTLQGTAASVQADTGDGSIEGSALESKIVSASTGDGSVRLQWDGAPSRVTSSTGDGSIDVTVPNHSGPYAIQQSGSGSSNIAVATDPGAAASMQLSTGDGSIGVHYGG